MSARHNSTGPAAVGTIDPQSVSHVRLSRIAAFIFVAMFSALTVKLAWSGYLQSDDVFYSEAARGWVSHFPYLGQTHWGLRYPIVWPIAISFALFGESEVALLAPILLYYAALLLLTFWCVSKIGGFAAGLLAVALVTVTPVLAMGASFVATDIPEAFYIISSLWVFYFAWNPYRPALFALSGALAGLGILTRETTAALLLFYGILFLANVGRSRAAYLWMAAGFLPIAAIDMLTLWLASGDPIYRLSMSIKGIHNDNPLLAGQYATAPGLDRFGALDVPKWLKPFVVLLANQNFGLIIWAAVLAAPFVVWGLPPSELRRAAHIFVGFALTWVLTLCYGLSDYLYIDARYLLVVAPAMVVALALWAVPLLASRRRYFVATGLAAVFAVNLALLDSRNSDIMFGERSLVHFTQKFDGEVLTDPSTLIGAAWLLDVAGTRQRVEIAQPRPGAVYFLNSQPRRPLPPEWRAIKPGSDWQVVERYESEPRLVATIAKRLGVDRLLPTGLAHKLVPEPVTAIAYRLPKS